MLISDDAVTIQTTNRKDYSLVVGIEAVAPGWAESPCSAVGGSASSSRMNVPLEPLKWAFLLFYLALAGVSNWAVLAYTHDFVPRNALPDILFKILPEQEWASRAGDWMVTTCLLCLVLLIIFHEARIVVARRVLFVLGTLYAMRSCTLLVTQLPPGYVNNTMRCREQVSNSTFQLFLSRLAEQTIRLGFQEKLGMLCGDLLFSGHTLVMVTCSLFVASYLPKRWNLLQWIPNAATAFGLLCMIISRTHYTIDILIAYWLSNFVFRIYHAYCELDECLERRKSILYDLWLLRIVEWLEENIVPGRVTNSFSAPWTDLFRSFCFSSGHHKQISISSSTTFP